MTRPFRLLLVEPEVSGHRMALHVRLIASEALARGWHVDLMTSASAVGHPALSTVQALLPPESRLHLLPPVPRASGQSRWSLLRQQWSYFRVMAEGIERMAGDERPTMTYFINLDNFYQALAVARQPLAGVPFAGMMMGVKYHRKAMGIGPGARRDGLARLLFRRVLRVPSLRAVTIIDEAFYRYSRAAAVPEYDKLAYVPDVGLLEARIPRREARRLLGIGDEAFVVLVYGALSARKGMVELIAATAASDNRRVVLLLAGSADQDAESILRSPEAQLLAARGQLVRSAGFHDGEREGAVFGAADAVWIGYVGFFGSSGVIYQAGAAGLPVVAAREGQLGWLTTTHGIGVCCNPSDGRDVAAAMATLMERPDIAAEYGARGKSLAERHSPALFAGAICNAIERAAGIRSD